MIESLCSEVDSLLEENAQLGGGHMNHKQKIKLHSRLKEESNALKLEVQLFIFKRSII